MIGIFGGIILIILSAAVIGANTTAMFEGKGAALGIVVIVLLAVAVGSLLFQVIDLFLLTNVKSFFHHRSSSFDAVLH